MDKLREAARLGIISDAQLEELLAFFAKEPARMEAPRGFNWTTVAYAIGATLVVFALGWLVIDHWESLGAGGVLSVALAYAAIFIGGAWVLMRHGYPTAGGIAVMLAVATTPLVFWSLENLTGVWVPWRLFFIEGRGKSWDTGRWAMIQLATIGSALLAIRLVRFAPIAAFATIPALTLAIPVAELLFERAIQGQMSQWMLLLFGAIAVAVAYVVDRRDEDRVGYAGWIYSFALMAVAVGLAPVWSRYDGQRFLFPVVFLLAIAAALRLRRRPLLVFGALGLFAYLEYLAWDVFRDSAFFPVALAAVGIVVIGATVLLQRHYPRFVARASTPEREGERGGRPGVPGGLLTMSAPAVIALLLLVAAPARERVEARQRTVLRARAASATGRPPPAQRIESRGTGATGRPERAGGKVIAPAKQRGSRERE